MSLKEDLDYLEETKRLIKEAIRDKGQEITTVDTFRSYVDKIYNISTGGHAYYIPKFQHSLSDAMIGQTSTLAIDKAYITMDLIQGDIILGNYNDVNNTNNLTMNSVISVEENSLINTKYTITFTYLGILKGVIDTQDATAAAINIETGKTAYINGSKVTGTLQTIEPYNNREVTSIYVNNDNTLVENTMGYPILMKQNSRLLLDNNIVISALHLNAADIKEGVTLFGLTGTLRELDTSDANATAVDLIEGKTAYVNDVKITGTLTPYLGTIQSSTSTTLQNDGLLVKTRFNNKMYADTNTDISIKTSLADTASAIGLTADKIKQGVTVLGIAGSVEPIPVNTTRVTTEGTGYSADSITETSNYITIAKSSVNPTLISSNVNYKYNVSKTATATAIGLTADKIAEGETILGIEGTHSGSAITEDATAYASDIISGKTAYARNTKLTGTIPVYDGNTILTKDDIIYNNNGLSYYSGLFDTTGYVIKNGRIIITASDSEIANAASLTSNMIANGTTLFGVLGTYVGDSAISQEEYDACEALANSIWPSAI